AVIALSTRVMSRKQKAIAAETPNIVVLRARLMDQPRAMRYRGIAPPAMFPTASAANGIQAYFPRSARLNPRSCCRYFGIQNVRKYVTGSRRMRGIMHPQVSGRDNSFTMPTGLAADDAVARSARISDRSAAVNLPWASGRS